MRRRSSRDPLALGKPEHQIEVLDRLRGCALPQIVDRGEHDHARGARVLVHRDPADVRLAHVTDAGRRIGQLDERLENVGKTLIIIRAGSRTQNGTLADVKPLTNEEAALLRKQLRASTTGFAEVQATISIYARRQKGRHFVF